MERRSRLVLFGVGVVVVALVYLLYQAAGRTLQTPDENGASSGSSIEAGSETPAPAP